MNAAVETPVDLESYRADRRRGRPEGAFGIVGALEERVMEGESLTFERIEADVPEFKSLRACRAAAGDVVLDLGAGMGEVIKAGVAIPLELMVAQETAARLKRSLDALVAHDLVENRGHRAIVVALRGQEDDGA